MKKVGEDALSENGTDDDEERHGAEGLTLTQTTAKKTRKKRSESNEVVARNRQKNKRVEIHKLM